MIDPRQHGLTHNRRWFRYSMILVLLFLAEVIAALVIATTFWPEHRSSAVRSEAPPTPLPIVGVPTGRVLIGISPQPQSAVLVTPGATPSIFCTYFAEGSGPDVRLSFRWQRLPDPGPLYTFTDTYSSAPMDSYLNGPFQPGQYQCSVYALMDGTFQFMNSASFTVRG